MHKDHQAPLFVVAAIALVFTSAAYAQTSVAYDNPVWAGNQAWTGNLGLDFNVNSPIRIQALGAFDNNADGFTGTVNVAIFSLDTSTMVAGPVALTGTSGILHNGARFIPLATPVALQPGHYTVVAVGFNATDLNGNEHNGGWNAPTLNDGGGLISFVGTGRYDFNTTLDIPAIIDVGPPAVYAAGTFAFAPTPPADEFQVGYANVAAGDAFVNITNNGASDPPATPGTLCVYVYAFDPSEEMLSCCTCKVTPNGLASISVKNSLLAKTATGENPSSVVIKLVATAYTGGVCDAANTNGVNLAPGMRAWATTLHALQGGGVALTENSFGQGTLSSAEGTHLTAFCGFLEGNGTGHGVCAGCSPGGN